MCWTDGEEVGRPRRWTRHIGHDAVLSGEEVVGWTATRFYGEAVGRTEAVCSDGQNRVGRGT